MKKKLNKTKLLEEIRIEVRKVAGWDHYTIYCYHSSFSKKTFRCETNLKITPKAKEKIVDMIIADSEAEEHNTNLYWEEDKLHANFRREMDYIVSAILWNDEKMERILSVLTDDCEDLAINEFLQSLLNLKSIKESIVDNKAQKKARINMI